MSDNYGIRHDLAFADYRADDITQADTIQTVAGKAVSKSMITDFMADPGIWKKSSKKIATAAMKSGSLLDCLLTTPAAFSSQYIVAEYAEFRSTEAKFWKASHEDMGKIVIKQSELDQSNAQLSAIMAHPEAAKLILGSRKQVAFRHKTAYPFDAKGLIDIVPDCGDVLVDLKKCKSSALESKRALRRYIFEWGYHIQAGAYCQGWSEATSEEVFRFKFIFVGESAPFTVAVVELPLIAILFGADLYNAGMKRFNECLELNKWPSLWDDTVTLDVPDYAYLGDGE